MLDIFGILLIFTGATSGLLVQDPVVCRFNVSNQCYVALGQRLHLQMLPEDGFNLNIRDKTNTTLKILKYRKTQSNPPTPNLPRWQFVNGNKTMILTSAERRDSGTYTLETFDTNGITKGIYTLQLNTEAKVSSVNVSYSCLSPGVMKVYCSADGENLHFYWTSDSISLPQLENGNNTLILDKDHHGNVTCHVENHVSHHNITTELQSCPEPTTTSSTMVTTARISTQSLGTNSTVSYTETNNTTQNYTTISNNILLLENHILIILGSICGLLIVISILAFYVYKKKQGQKNKEAPSQEGGELVYAQVSHLPMDRIEARPGTSPAQDEGVEYATVINRASKKKQKKTEDDVQYGELVFNTPAKTKNEAPKVQDDCVYSQVQHSR